jgi:hypothetical protein
MTPARARISNLLHHWPLPTPRISADLSDRALAWRIDTAAGPRVAKLTFDGPEHVEPGLRIAAFLDAAGIPHHKRNRAARRPCRRDPILTLAVKPRRLTAPHFSSSERHQNAVRTPSLPPQPSFRDQAATVGIRCSHRACCSVEINAIVDSAP